MGSLEVLNCHLGHLEINFDKGDPDDAGRAKKVIADMMKRGYSLFVEVAGELKRVSKFDPENEAYIVMMPEDGAEKPKLGKKRVMKPRTYKMREHKATGVGRTAGG